MYLPSRDRVVALDGDSGALVWEYVLPAPPPAAGRGSAPGTRRRWSDGLDARRQLLAR